jgi:hypothetical protein
VQKFAPLYVGGNYGSKPGGVCTDLEWLGDWLWMEITDHRIRSRFLKLLLVRDRFHSVWRFLHRTLLWWTAILTISLNSKARDPFF